MDANSLTALAQIGASITTSGFLLMAWMLERRNVEKERERADRNEAVIIRMLETMAAVQKMASPN